MKNKAWFFFMMASCGVFANVTLPAVFSDHMVLQRNANVRIWGWGNPNEEIKVRTSWDNVDYQAKANNQAYWEVTVKTNEAGGPYTISIKGYNEMVLDDILLGEVWLCSGQSNMEMSASWGIENGDFEVAQANYPNIRFFNVAKSTAPSPQNDVRANWVACTPETMRNFSATAYFFGKKLQEDLKNVPIGLVASCWGGSPAEIWMPEAIVNDNPVLAAAAKKIKEGEWCPSHPGRAFNAMVAPLIPFKIAGVIWYQGESNVGSKVYDQTFSALIKSWRQLWQQDFPFYFVQIAPFDDGHAHDGGVIIRDAQRRTLALPHTGMVVTSDISTTSDIHPKNKKSVGTRLANLALAHTYKTFAGTTNGPLFRSIAIEKSTVSVFFDDAEGLHFKNKKPDEFEVAGSDQLFYKAKASIQGNVVKLHSSQVKNPVHVRFAWNNAAQSHLFNNAGLPASSFLSE